MFGLLDKVVQSGLASHLKQFLPIRLNVTIAISVAIVTSIVIGHDQPVTQSMSVYNRVQGVNCLRCYFPVMESMVDP